MSERFLLIFSPPPKKGGDGGGGGVKGAFEIISSVALPFASALPNLLVLPPFVFCFFWFVLLSRSSPIGCQTLARKSKVVKKGLAASKTGVARTTNRFCR